MSSQFRTVLVLCYTFYGTYCSLNAQVMDNHEWYFGRNAAISFSQRGVEPSRWNDTAYAGAGMFWDQTGKPVVYSGWKTTFNAVGDTLGNCRYFYNLGYPAMLMFRKPGSRDTVYAYQTYHGHSLDYGQGDNFLSEGSSTINIIDLKANDQRGKLYLEAKTIVSALNVPNNPDRVQIGASACLVPHVNGRDLWLVSPMIIPAGWRVYLISRDSIQLHQSVLTPELPRSWWETNLGGVLWECIGETKVSPNGRMIASIGGVRGRVILADFDPALGQVLNSRQIGDTALFLDEDRAVLMRRTVFPVTARPMGCEFSPDGKLLYIANGSYTDATAMPIEDFEIPFLDSLPGELRQYDVTLRYADSIRNSKQIVVPFSKVNAFAGLQRGPDNRIYVAQREKNFVSRINKPNERGTACEFERMAVVFPDTNTICTMGFPTMMPTISDYQLRIPDLDLCQGDTAVLPLQGSFVTDSVVWSFGGSGKVGVHYFDQPGAYQVSATMYVASEPKSPVYAWVYVHENPTATVTARSNEICAGDTVKLTGVGGVTASWYVGPTLVSEGRTTVVSPQQTTTYTCIVRTAFGCLDTTQFTLTVKPTATLQLAGPTTVCAGDSIELVATGTDGYQWTSVPIDATMQVQGGRVMARPTQTTRYTCVGSTGAMCDARIEHTVIVNPKPNVRTANDTSFCEPVPFELTASGADQYVWITEAGDTVSRTRTVNLTPTSTMKLRVVGRTLAGCTGEDTVTITRTLNASITVGGDTLLCEQVAITLTAAGSNAIVWLDKQGQQIGTGPTITVSPTVTTTYRAIDASGAGCADTTEHTVVVSQRPQLAVTATTPFVCINDTAMLTATGCYRYEWYTAGGVLVSTDPQIRSVITAPTTFRVYGYDSAGCRTESSMTINTLPPSSIRIAVDDTTFDVGDGLQTIPILLHVPSAYVGNTIGPIEAEISVRRASLHIEDYDPTIITGSTVNDSNVILLMYVPVITVSETPQELTMLSVRPLIDDDSVSRISIRLLRLDGIPLCGSDSVNHGAITVTGCGRNMYGGITLVTPPSMRVDPNPATDHITIHATSGLPGAHTIEVVNILGQIVYQRSVQVAPGTELQESPRIPTSDLGQGLHEVRFLTPVGMLSSTFMVVK